MNFLKWIKLLIKREESIVFDLEEDFKNNLLRFFIKLFSEIGSSIVITVIFISIGLIYGLKTFLTISFIYMFQLVLVEIVKLIFKRKRPKTFKEGSILGVKSTSGSFPSGHTSNAYSVALILSNIFRTNIYITAIFFSIAGLVAASRIFLGKHYILDVIGGAIFGMIFSLIGIWTYSLLYSTFFLK